MRKKVKLIDGREVKEAMRPHKISLHTSCIRKWAVVDLETGEMLACNGGRSAWGGRRPRLDMAGPETITLVKKIANEYEAIQQTKRDKQQAEHDEMMKKMWARIRNEARTERWTTATSVSGSVRSSNLPYPYSTPEQEIAAQLNEINQGAIEEAVRAETMPEMSVEIDRGHPVAYRAVAGPPPTSGYAPTDVPVDPVAAPDFELTTFSAVSEPTDPVARVSSPSSYYQRTYARPVNGGAGETVERPDHIGPRGTVNNPIVTNPCAEHIVSVPANRFTPEVIRAIQTEAARHDWRGGPAHAAYAAPMTARLSRNEVIQQDNTRAAEAVSEALAEREVRAAVEGIDWQTEVGE